MKEQINYEKMSFDFNLIEKQLVFKINLIEKHKKGKAVLFGLSDNMFEELQENCFVTVLNSSHRKAQINTINQFKITGIRYFCENPNQFKQKFSYIYNDLFGYSVVKSILFKIDEDSYIKDIVQCKGIICEMDINSRLEIELLPEIGEILVMLDIAPNIK